MKVFFSMRHLGSLRLYESAIRELAARGHQVHLSLGRAEAHGWTAALAALAAEHPSVSWSWPAPTGSPFWSEVGDTVRLWADYLRYFDPAYAAAPKLKARIEERLPPRLVTFTNRPIFRKAANRRRLRQTLRALERALPASRDVERQLREAQPDVVLVTPLVHVGLGVSQFEMLRTALALGLRTAFCVGSWDHLSSKALIREMPHRVFAWNDTQRRELMDLHGVPADRIVVSGAQCYDQWFGRQPSRAREDFCRHVGLPADRPFLLYVCSALFPGSPSEAAFVRDWIVRLRASRHPVLRDAGVLVRPHPQRTDEWRSIDLAGVEGVTVWSGSGAGEEGRADYFDSLYHSAAIVGLNTSAFLEGAIVGRAVHTILLPEFHENQEGTLHFHYLLAVGGGVLRDARSFDEHYAQLAASLEDPSTGAADAFVREFIRPRGIDVAATPVFCDAVDELARLPAPIAERTPASARLLRWSLYPALRLLHRIYGAELFRDDWSRRERAAQERRDAKERKRQARAQRADAALRAKEQRRREKLAAREAAERAAGETHARAIADKAQRQLAKSRDRSARVRQRDRAAARARLKQRIKTWLGGTPLTRSAVKAFLETGRSGRPGGSVPGGQGQEGTSPRRSGRHRT